MAESPAVSARKAIAGTLIRHAVTTAETVLIVRGYIDEQTVGAATGPIADYVLGAALAMGDGVEGSGSTFAARLNGRKRSTSVATITAAIKIAILLMPPL